MYDTQFANNERRIRTRAKLYTALVFGSLIAATLYFGNGQSFDFSKNANVKVDTQIKKKVNTHPAKSVPVSKERKHRKRA